MNPELELEIFRAGDYGAKGRWTEDQLDQIASGYDADLHEAPVTLDHAQSGPAMGWVAGVRRCGDRLVARLRGLDDGLRQLLRSGAFKKRSVELYRELPETGKPYLKAVSFLGAAAPVVKGLRDAVFSESEPADLFRAELGESCALDFAEPGFGAEPPRSEDSRSDDPRSDDPSDAEPPTAVRSAPSVNFAQLRSELRGEGRWVPAWDQRGIEGFYETLRSHTALTETDATAMPSGDQAVDAASWFADFLRALPATVSLGESAPAGRPHARQGIPNGEGVSAGSIALHRRVVRMCESEPGLNYGDALIACAKD